MSLNFYTFFISFLLFEKCKSNPKLLCTQEFCDDYVQKFPCPPLDPKCSNPNISLVLPSPTPCNCCQHCFIYQDVGENCVVGNPITPLPNVMCGPETECQEGICREKKVPDSDFYPGYECEKGLCYCAVIENNAPKKIFGTFVNSTQVLKERQCGCSIYTYNAREVINTVLPVPDLFLPTLRCLPNGQFEELQCIDNLCGCVNKQTGVWDSSVRKVAVAALGPNNPKCFDRTRHRAGEYYKMCELERNNLISDIFWAQSEDIELIFTRKVKCTPDGEYALSTDQF